MRTRIDIPSSGTIDLYEDVGISLNYSIADIQNPSARNASFSKTITVPGTKNNNDLFLNIFDLGSEGGFNPNLKTKAIVYVDTIPVMDGYLQLTNILKNDKNEISYELTIYGRLGNIFTIWGDDELRDIDFSSLNHVYNRTNITNSWTNNFTSGYYYPMIDYALTDGTYYNVEHFFPATYLRTYIDKIFTYAGYTYTSNFLTSSYFNNLIIPMQGFKMELSAQSISDRTFRAVNTASYDLTLTHGSSATANNTIAFNSLTTSPNPAGQYNTATYYWTVNNTGKYNVYWNITADVTVNNPTGGNITSAQFFNNVIAGLEYSTDGGTTWSFFSLETNQFYVSAQTFGAGTTTQVWTGITNSGGITAKLDAGTILRMRVGGYTAVSSSSLVVKYKINTNSAFYNKPLADVVDGDTIDYNDTIPDKVKISDLFMSVVKLFNLYVEENKNKDKDLIIEPRNDFYTSGTTYDWTAKLDISQPLDIRPMGALDVRDFLYTYKEDSDYWNKRYKGQTRKIFGDRKVSTNNDFYTGNKTTEVIFSPSPSVQMPIGSVSSNRIYPQIIEVDSSGVPAPTKSGLRLLQRSALRNTNTSWRFDYSGGSTTYTTYPYAGHLDNPLDPTEDLNFGVPEYLEYTPNGYTNNNLFNKYYKKFIDEITDKESKLVTGYFYLKPLDILQLDFRNTIFVDGHYYRINKIEDYNPTAESLTKVELLKIKEGVPFVPTSGTITTGALIFNIDETGAGLGFLQKKDESTYGQNAIVQGYKNYVNSTAIKVIVNGAYNTVGGGSENIVLLNSSGVTVMPGLQNVTAINTSGVTISQSNVTYIGGVAQSNPATSIRTIYSNYTMVDTDDLILVGASSLVITLNTPSIGKKFTIKNLSSYGSTTVTHPSYTIDGTIGYTISSPNDYITIEYTGSGKFVITANGL